MTQHQIPDQQLRQLVHEYRHIQNEIQREGSEDARRRKQSKHLQDVHGRIEHLIDHWITEEPLRAQWRDYLAHQRLPEPPLPGFEAPLLFFGRSESGTVLDVREKPDGTRETKIDGTPVRSRLAHGALTRSLQLDDLRFEETFELSGEAVEAFQAFAADSRRAPRQWSKTLYEQGLIDLNSGVTDRGRRFLSRYGA